MPPARDQFKAAPPKWWAFVLAGLCYAIFTAMAFPPASVWVLAVFAPLPLVWAGCRAMQKPWRAGLLTALGTMPLWIYEQSWLWNVTKVGYPLLVLYLSLFAGLFVTLFAMVKRAWLPRGSYAPLLPAFVVAPVLWVALEVLRGEVLLTGYPWYLAGHPLIESPRLAAPASLFGAYFVSFLLVGLSSALADAAGWMGVRRGMGGAGAAAIFMVWMVTSVVGKAPTEHAGSVRIAVIQTNVPQDNKVFWTLEQKIADFQEFAKLTREAAANRPRPDVIVWPETMFPGEALNEEFRRDAMKILQDRKIDPRTRSEVGFIAPLMQLQTDIGVPLVVGAEAVEELTVKEKDGEEYFSRGRRFNSVYVVEGGAIRDERYDKIELTPFGEVIPYIWRWPSAQRLVESVGAGGMKFDLSAGTQEHVFSMRVSSSTTAARTEGRTEDGEKMLTFVTPICFEATKSELCRRLVYKEGERQADLIVNMSNDGWFGKTGGWLGSISGGRAQHLQASRWRCVELGTPMIRAVNTGISAFVDATGKIRQAGLDGRDSAVNVSGVLTGTVNIPPRAARTVFGRIGNGFGWMMVGLSLVGPFGGLAFRQPRSNRS